MGARLARARACPRRSDYSHAATSLPYRVNAQAGLSLGAQALQRALQTATHRAYCALIKSPPSPHRIPTPRWAQCSRSNRCADILLPSREEPTSDFNELWIWLTAFTSSIPFIGAVTILFAGSLASLVDWAEHYLTAHQQDLGSEDHRGWLQRHPRVGAIRGQLNPSLKPDIAHR
jgi:hypothetical protein